LTLGLAFRQAGVDVKTSTIMIMIQAIMNPIGVGLGWILSSQGYLITSIFEGISAGTFVYIATMEVIVEEFSISRYKWQKFGIFLIAIAFICSIWFMEQLTEGN
jgi:zinc transporter 1/2/3